RPGGPGPHGGGEHAVGDEGPVQPAANDAADEVPERPVRWGPGHGPVSPQPADAGAAGVRGARAAAGEPLRRGRGADREAGRTGGQILLAAEVVADQRIAAYDQAGQSAVALGVKAYYAGRRRVAWVPDAPWDAALLYVDHDTPTGPLVVTDQPGNNPPRVLTE